MATPTLQQYLVLFFALLFSLQSLVVQQVHGFEHQVGGLKGWSVPQPNDTKLYNAWASQTRFQLGDTIRFKYRRDSVLEVIEEDYYKCNSSHPNFFSNIGNTIFKLDRRGSFYFISGVSGHCERGQRIIIKVKTPSDGHKSSTGPLVVSSLLSIVFMFFLSFVASFVV